MERLCIGMLLALESRAAKQNETAVPRTWTNCTLPTPMNFLKSDSSFIASHDKEILLTAYSSLLEVKHTCGGTSVHNDR